MVFDGAFAEKPQHKAYEVEYGVQSNANLVKIQDKEIEQVATILGELLQQGGDPMSYPHTSPRSRCLQRIPYPTNAGLSQDDSATLLRYFRWNKEKLFERYMETPDKVMRSAGINTGDDANQAIMRAKDLPLKEPFVCDICCDDDPDMETVCVACGHRFCKTCYVHYLQQKIQNEGESRRIECPQDKCNVIVDEKTVEKLVDSKTMAKYRTLLNRTFVDDNDFLRWCPAPDCEYAIECHIPSTSLTSIVPTVQCACGYKFCFGCGLADHQVWRKIE